MAVSPGKVRAPKRKVSVSLSDEAIKGLERIGVQYGLKLSNMLERAARYYLEEYEDIEIAYQRSKSGEETLSAEEARKYLELDD